MTDREKLKRIVEKAAFSCLPSNTQPLHINMLTIELLANGVVVREKGEWVDHGVRDWRCPKCGEKIKKVRNVDGYCYDDKPNFCPNCGADMRIEEQNRARRDCDSSDICIECWDEVDLFYGSSPCVDLPVGKERNK